MAVQYSPLLLLFRVYLYPQDFLLANFTSPSMRNFVLVMGACCNWQPDKLPIRRNGFESRRLHHSLS